MTDENNGSCNGCRHGHYQSDLVVMTGKSSTETPALTECRALPPTVMMVGVDRRSGAPGFLAVYPRQTGEGLRCGHYARCKPLQDPVAK